jgi:hypothetical protein
MSEKQVIPQHTSALAFETYAPTAPILSSVQAGWEGIIVRTYHEPTVVESVIAPAVPDISLVMVTRGAMAFESRDVGGSWEAFTTVEGDWFLTPGGGRPYELHWSSLSSEPIQTLHVHVSTDLVARAALQLADRDPARVELVERSGFQDPLLAQMGLALRQELLDPALEPFQVFVGQWQTTGSHPYLPGSILHGRTTFDWLAGGAFLIMHTEIDHPSFPDGVAIFGSDDVAKTYFQLTFDERGVSRKYDVTITGNQLKWWRDEPSFSQRATVTIEDNGNKMESQGEMSRDGAAWEKDLALTYVRVS